MDNTFFLNGSCVLETIVDRNTLTPLYWDFDLQQQKNEAYARTILQLLIFLTGVPLNLYVICKILWKRLFTQPTYLLLLNLAVADLLACLVSLPFNIASGFVGHFSFGNSDYIRCQVCKISAFFVLLTNLSFFNLALISLDRFAFFKIPLRYNVIITAKKTALALLGIWVLSTALVIPHLFGYGDVSFSTSCGFIFTAPNHIKRSIVSLIVSSIVFSAVMLVLIITNVWIVCIALKQIKATSKAENIQLQPISDEAQTNEQLKGKKAKEKKLAKKQFKLFKVFGGILLVDIITLLPAIALVIALVFTTSVPTGFWLFVLICIMSQVTFHPLVEAFLTPKLRIRLPKWCKPKFFDSLAENKAWKVGQTLCSKIPSCGCAERCTMALEELTLESEA